MAMVSCEEKDNNFKISEKISVRMSNYLMELFLKF